MGKHRLLRTQLSLFHNMKPVYTGNGTSLQTDQKTELIAVWEKLAPHKHNWATQWMDLEVE
jgi:hypothetical protein